MLEASGDLGVTKYGTLYVYLSDTSEVIRALEYGYSINLTGSGNWAGGLYIYFRNYTTGSTKLLGQYNYNGKGAFSLSSMSIFKNNSTNNAFVFESPNDSFGFSVNCGNYSSYQTTINYVSIITTSVA